MDFKKYAFDIIVFLILGMTFLVSFLITTSYLEAI